MLYDIYDCYEGLSYYVGTAVSQKQAETMMMDYFDEVDDEANLYAIREDGKTFVLGYECILEEVKQ
jgi:hypothetical protein